MAVLHVDEGIDVRREVARQNQARHARAVGLEGDGDDVAHQAGVLAQIFGQAIGGAVHAGGGAIGRLWP